MGTCPVAAAGALNVLLGRTGSRALLSSLRRRAAGRVAPRGQADDGGTVAPPALGRAAVAGKMSANSVSEPIVAASIPPPSDLAIDSRTLDPNPVDVASE